LYFDPNSRPHARRAPDDAAYGRARPPSFTHPDTSQFSTSPQPCDRSFTARDSNTLPLTPGATLDPTDS